MNRVYLRTGLLNIISQKTPDSSLINDIIKIYESFK